LNSLIKNIDEITELYKDAENDFFILENKCSIEYLCKKIDSYDFGRMKCYSLVDVSDDLLINYFKVTYCSSENPIIFKNEVTHLVYNTQFNERHEIINSLTSTNQKYLEIGVEYGYTYKNTHFSNKIGVDPDPKCEMPGLQKYTSDDYFKQCSNNTTYDVVFIDGMHHAENVLKDLNNSISSLNKNGCIFIDDIIPLNYNEQLKIPRKHHYENGVLKYGEEWTGDVWKVIYHLLLNFRKNINIGYYYNINYRGVLHLTIKEKFVILETDIDEINRYDYFSCFNHYLRLLSGEN
jgi:hypothetical protein